jgi:hypothetical protein
MNKSLKMILIAIIAILIVWWFMKKNEHFGCTRPKTIPDTCDFEKNKNCECPKDYHCNKKKSICVEN